MTHLIITSILTILLQLSPDVRNVRWGMSEKQIRKAENAPLKVEKPEEGTSFSRVLTREDKIAGQSVSVLYGLTDNKLTEVGVLAMPSREKCATTFTAFLGLFTQKYGSPSVADSSFAHWQTSRTKISLKKEVSYCLISIHYRQQIPDAGASGL